MPTGRIRGVTIRQHSFMYNSSLEAAAAQSTSSSAEDSLIIADVEDPLFGFLDGSYVESSSSPEMMSSDERMGFGADEDQNEDDGGNGEEQDGSFWENQHQLLQATLCRTSSLETAIRNVTKEAVKELQMAEKICGCGRAMVGGCRSCLMSEISGRLRNAGYNSAICRTKWRSSPDIPSGEHTFIDVVDNSSKKRGEVRIIIELNFRPEFEIAKASEEYNRLVRRLPEVFVGKVDRLKDVIKIVCLAAKKCMKEKKMHMGPWRKYRYMQAKWLGSPVERRSPAATSSGDFATGYLGRYPKARSSMLTVDLTSLDVFSNVHCTAVGVM
ncbi:hypothetical protein LINGRAHAP2_LOCUS5511 [Linum grandiflorum]